MGNVNSISKRKSALSGLEALRAKFRFRQVTGKYADEITPEQFKTLLGPSGEPCAEPLFRFVDSDHSGSLSYKEIHKDIQTFRSLKTAAAKLQVLFRFYDQDQDGKLSQSEIAAAMTMACPALPERQLNQLATVMMEEFDVDRDGFLNFEEFSALIRASGLELSV